MRKLAISILSFLFFYSTSLAQNPDFIMKKGILDLSNWNFERDGNVEIHGEWEFYWKQLIEPQEFSRQEIHPQVFYYAPQRKWNNLEIADSAIGYAGFATVRAIILLPKNTEKGRIGIKWRTITSSFKLFANNIEIGKAGVVGTTEEEAIAKFDPNHAVFSISSDTLEIVAHISNFHHRNGGMWYPFVIGKAEMIKKAQQNRIIKEVFLAGCLFIMAIYHLGFYRLRRRDKSTIYFSMTCLFLFFRILTTGETQFTEFISEDWSLLTRVYYLALLNACYFFMRFMTTLFKENAFPAITKMAKWLAIISSLYVILVPTYYITFSLYAFYILISFASINSLKATLQALRSKKNGAKFFVLATVGLLLASIHDIVIDATEMKGEHWAYWGMLSFVLIQAYVLSLRFADAFKRSEILGGKLKLLNRSLEAKVNERTAELATSNESLLQFNEALVYTNNMMTASISYAQRIQKALLVDWKQVKKSFENSFVLFKPRDIVSGDFYWFTRNDQKAIFAMLDCTGHGVPGAFMSIIGNELLNKITHEISPQNWDATTILEKMDKGIRKNLAQEESNIQDGMDMGLCIIDFESKKMQFAGAKAPLLYFQNGEEFLIKGCRKPIGGDTFQSISYESQTVDVSVPTFFYLYSDGYQDQFGGSKGKKFMSKRFRKLLAELHQKKATKQKKILKDKLNEWKGLSSQVDDILVMGVEIDLTHE